MNHGFGRLDEGKIVVHREGPVVKGARDVESDLDAGSGIGVVRSAQRPDRLLGLARAAAHRDPSASETLVLQIGGGVLSTVRHVLGPAHPDVEDVAQEAVIAFLNALKDFRGDCATSTYAKRVALFTALAARRRLLDERRVVDSEPVSESSGISLAADPLAEVLASRRREILRKVLDSLPEVIAEALALHFMLGYTVDEIAASTSSPPNTIWSRLRLGKQALRAALQREDIAGVFGGDE